MMTLTHGLSGYVCGQVALPLLRRHAPLRTRMILGAFFLGAMLPDADFIVRVLGGREAYFSGAWYSHRMASHSILGTLAMGMAAAAIALALGLLRPPRAAAAQDPGTAAAPAPGASGTAPDGSAPAGAAGGSAAASPQPDSKLRRWAWASACFWAGGLLHLVGDIPTPGMALPLLWPLHWRYGGLSHIGWFTPYLFLMFSLMVLANLALHGLNGRIPRLGRWIAPALWLLNVATAFRWIEYMVVSRYESAALYAEYQRQLAPPALMDFSSSLVFSLWRVLTH